ncbi:MAG TPA: hypothetical protein VFQ92_07480, partial [Blastocatellia bacterium]|nr:hypothetical protein [Blastocatellia bacterium]
MTVALVFESDAASLSLIEELAANPAVEEVLAINQDGSGIESSLSGKIRILPIESYLSGSIN